MASTSTPATSDLNSDILVKILAAVTGLGTKIDGLGTKIDGLGEKIDNLPVRMHQVAHDRISHNSKILDSSNSPMFALQTIGFGGHQSEFDIFLASVESFLSAIGKDETSVKSLLSATDKDDTSLIQLPSALFKLFGLSENDFGVLPVVAAAESRVSLRAAGKSVGSVAARAQSQADSVQAPPPHLHFPAEGASTSKIYTPAVWKANFNALWGHLSSAQFAKRRNVLVYGPPGSSKSTLCMSLALKYACGHNQSVLWTRAVGSDKFSYLFMNFALSQVLFGSFNRLEDIDDFLQTQAISVWIVDNVTDKIKSSVQSVAFNWWKQREHQRQVVFCTSMQGFGMDSQFFAMRFVDLRVEYWPRDVVLTCVEQMWDVCWRKFMPEPSESAPPFSLALVLAKLYFSGPNLRQLLGTYFDIAKRNVDTEMQKLDSLDMARIWSSDAGKNAVNLLIYDKAPVSDYVASKLSSSLRCWFVDAFWQSSAAKDPRQVGNIFEFQLGSFLADLKNKPVADRAMQICFTHASMNFSVPIYSLANFDSFNGSIVANLSRDEVEGGVMFVPNSLMQKLFDVVHLMADSPAARDQENVDPNTLLGSVSASSGAALAADQGKSTSSQPRQGPNGGFTIQGLNLRSGNPNPNPNPKPKPDKKSGNRAVLGVAGTDASAVESSIAQMSIQDTGVAATAAKALTPTPIVVRYFNTTISLEHPFNYLNYEQALEKLALNDDFSKKYRIVRAEFYFLCPFEFRSPGLEVKCSGFHEWKTSTDALHGTVVQYHASAFADPHVTIAYTKEYAHLAAKKKDKL